MATKAAAISQARQITHTAHMDLAIPECEKGIGAVISSLHSTQLIDGVCLQPIALWPDDRGYFLEVQRLGQGLAAHFPAESTQVSAALNYPGTIKAFHYHLHQHDCWTPVAGLLQPGQNDEPSGMLFPQFGQYMAHSDTTLRAACQVW